MCSYLEEVAHFHDYFGYTTRIRNVRLILSMIIYRTLRYSGEEEAEYLFSVSSDSGPVRKSYGRMENMERSREQ